MTNRDVKDGSIVIWHVSLFSVTGLAIARHATIKVSNVEHSLEK